jgi:hypothetical protein
LFDNLQHDIQWEAEVVPLSKVVHSIQIYPFAKFANFWTSGCSHFVFLKLDHLKSIEKALDYWKGTNEPSPV